MGKNFYRPRDAAAAAKYAHQFTSVPMVTVDAAFGGWAKAQPEFFGLGGYFDQAMGQSGSTFFGG